jgi:hypothetical protein
MRADGLDAGFAVAASPGTDIYNATIGCSTGPSSIQVNILRCPLHRHTAAVHTPVTVVISPSNTQRELFCADRGDRTQCRKGYAQ